MMKSGMFLPFRDKLGTFTTSKISHFCSYSSIFHLSPRKIWHPHPHKYLVCKISKDRTISSQSLESLNQKWQSLKAFENGCFWLHSVIEWLLWLPNNSNFINFTFLENLRDNSKTPPSLKFLERRVHELVGGTNPLPS